MQLDLLIEFSRAKHDVKMYGMPALEVEQVKTVYSGIQSFKIMAKTVSLCLSNLNNHQTLIWMD